MIRKDRIREVQKELQEREEQKELHEKYEEPDRNVRIIEKKPVVKTLLQAGGIAVRTTAMISILVLAFLGLLSLIYPETRDGLRKIIHDIINDLRHLIK